MTRDQKATLVRAARVAQMLNDSLHEESSEVSLVAARLLGETIRASMSQLQPAALLVAEELWQKSQRMLTEACAEFGLTRTSN